MQFGETQMYVALFIFVATYAALSFSNLSASAGGIPIWLILLLGAASNLIILEEAERGQRLTFHEFLKAGVVVTIANVVVLYAYLYAIA